MATETTTPVAAGDSGSASPWGADALASVVVFLVALPLCMGISIASGMPPTAGIITGIIGGIVVGAISGSPLQVSGPAAGLTVLVYDLVQAHGQAKVGFVILLAGLIQAVAGFLKLGQWFRAVSPAVIHGMLAGIGVLILASQFHIMFDGTTFGSGIKNLINIPTTLGNAIAAKDSHLTAGLIGLFTVAAIIGWEKLSPAKLKLVPAPLVGVMAAVILSAVLGLDGIRHIDVPSNIWATVKLPETSMLSSLNDPAVLIGAFSIALIASAESLLCATAVDKLHGGARTRYSPELVAQGVGNALCGLLDVLPMTGVIVRSSANVQAGAKTRLSAILHGVWLLVFASALPWTLRYIPISALAGLLVYTGYKLAYPRAVPELRRFGRVKVAIYFVTIATIVATDLLKGVALGLLLSILKLVYDFSRLNIRRVEKSSKEVELHLEGAATLLRLPQLAEELEKLDPGAHVHVYIEKLNYIDYACIDLMTNWDKQHRATGGSLTLDWPGLHARYGSDGVAEAPAAAV